MATTNSVTLSVTGADLNLSLSHPCFDVFGELIGNRQTPPRKVPRQVVVETLKKFDCDPDWFLLGAPYTKDLPWSWLSVRGHRVRKAGSVPTNLKPLPKGAGRFVPEGWTGASPYVGCSCTDCQALTQKVLSDPEFIALWWETYPDGAGLVTETQPKSIFEPDVLSLDADIPF